MTRIWMLAGLATGLAGQTAVVGYRNVRQTVTASATVEAPDPGRGVVESRFAGWIETVLVDTPGEAVAAGEPLCVLESPELKAAEEDYLAAVAYRGQLGAGAAAGAGERVVAAARARLAQEQVPAEEQERLARSGTATARLTLRAPEGGVVVARAAVPGMRVERDTELYTLATLDPIWVYAAVPEEQLGGVRAGATAALAMDAYPGRAFAGRVEAIEPRIAAASRTARVRIAVANPDDRLLPGMSGTARLSRGLGRRLVIPAAAVLQTGRAAVAFVDRGDGQYDRRALRLGPQVGDEYVVLGGVRAGERVSTAAPFLQDAEAQLGAAGAGYAPPPPGVGANAAAAGKRLALTTDPTPARKGENTVRVRLTPAEAGARVRATFFMAAMPAMGMAAMRSTVVLADHGGGMYEGTVRLGSGGTWQVTVEAEAGGRTVATLRTTVRATGGM